MARFFAQHLATPAIRRQARRSDDEPLVAPSPHQLVQLQQAIGNSGVRALLARRDAPVVQREPAIQRFWGDDEESEDEGGSWVSDLYDSASELVIDGANAVQDATDAAADWVSGGESESESSGGGSANMGPSPESDSGGGEKGWWEQATDEVESWFDGDESEQEPSEAESGGEKSWWDELWSEDDESESGESGDEEKSWWDDLLDNDEDEVTDEPPRDIEDISAECQTKNSVGHGEGKSIKLHGLTTSNYDHAKPLPAPFPSGVVVTERKVKVSKTVEQDVFDAKGTFDVTFASKPSISLPTVPDGLTPCQTKAVQAFIDGPLTSHENDHKAAFEDNYDGTFTATVNVSNIQDTAENRKRALENPVMAEDKRRADLANAESKKLDPWKETVSCLDCKEPQKKPAP